MKILGECWHCKEDARYENRDGFLHCDNCGIRVRGTDGEGNSQTVCGCQGPPRTCHKCLDPIKWGGWVTDDDGDSKKIGSCSCQKVSWVQVDFVNPKDTSITFHHEIDLD